MTYEGVVRRFTATLEGGERPAPGRLFAKRITAGSLASYVAIDSAGHLHVVLPPVEHADRLGRYNTQALTLSNKAWVLPGEAVAEYLDVECLAPEGSPLRRPFAIFAEDLLEELAKPPASVADVVARTCARWHRFWEDVPEETASIPWLLGLLGELHVLTQLVTEAGEGALVSWKGPDGADHDFQVPPTAAIEVKTVTRWPPEVECNLRQLDPAACSVLLLAVVTAAPTDDGVTLVDIVSEIEAKLRDSVALDDFWRRLAATGYRRSQEDAYRGHRFTITGPTFYLVDSLFPRITHTSFQPPLDARIQGVRYRLQITDVASLAEDSPVLKDALASFRSAHS